MKQRPIDRYLIPREVAELLGVTDMTVRRLFDAGVLTGIRADNGTRLIESESAIRYAQSLGRVSSGPVFTSVDVANELGVNQETLRDWANCGLIHAMRTPSGFYRYEAESFASVGRPVPARPPRRRPGPFAKVIQATLENDRATAGSSSSASSSTTNSGGFR